MAAVKGRRILRAETKGYVPKLMAAAIVVQAPRGLRLHAGRGRAGALAGHRGGHRRAGGRRSRAIARAAQVGEADAPRPQPGAAPRLHARRAPTRLKLPREAAVRFAEGWPTTSSVRPAPPSTATWSGRARPSAAIAARYGVSVDGDPRRSTRASAPAPPPRGRAAHPKGAPRPAAPHRRPRPPPAKPAPAPAAAAPVAVASRAAEAGDQLEGPAAATPSGPSRASAAGARGALPAQRHRRRQAPQAARSAPSSRCAASRG